MQHAPQANTPAPLARFNRAKEEQNARFLDIVIVLLRCVAAFSFCCCILSLCWSIG